jgi:hypothetical protein
MPFLDSLGEDEPSNRNNANPQTRPQNSPQPHPQSQNTQYPPQPQYQQQPQQYSQLNQAVSSKVQGAPLPNKKKKKALEPR